MHISNLLIIIVFTFIAVLIIGFAILWLTLLMIDRNQKRHAILRNYPVLGRIRYFFEKIGPEMRQYWFNSDNEGKPFSRDDYEHIIKNAKYMRDVIGFGSNGISTRKASLFAMICSPNYQRKLKWIEKLKYRLNDIFCKKILFFTKGRKMGK